MQVESATYLGYGLGLRPSHYQDILEQQPAVDWFEALTENYLVPGGKPSISWNRCALIIRSCCMAYRCRSAPANRSTSIIYAR